MKQPKLSLIIAYTASKDEFRYKALAKLMECIENQTFKDFEIILVEDTQGRGMSQFPFKKKVDKVIVLSDPEMRKFNKAWVMNVGARYANSEHLIFQDADCQWGNDFIEKIWEKIQTGIPLFTCWSIYHCLPGRDNPNLRICPITHVNALLGAFYCNSNFFFNELGGYNENYFGYGAEDNDIWKRAKFLLTEIPYMEYTIEHNYHHWHPVDGANPLNKLRTKILDNTRTYPKQVIDKLLKIKVGDSREPKCIKLEGEND